MNQGTLIVRGSDIMKPPLLETKDAKTVEFRDADGNLLCFWVRVFQDNPTRELWGWCSKSDADWEEMCIRYGYKQPVHIKNPQDLLDAIKEST